MVRSSWLMTSLLIAGCSGTPGAEQFEFRGNASVLSPEAGPNVTSSADAGAIDGAAGERAARDSAAPVDAGAQQ